MTDPIPSSLIAPIPPDSGGGSTPLSRRSVFHYFN